MWPKYNPKSKCIKCGCKDVKTFYHSKNDVCHNYSPFAVCYQAEEEHMLRHCTNCQYRWLEQPLNNNK